ncbi:YheC/YheD family protein [Brevibacillus composti]|uniref:YheC/YheD family protein n=1 Tax=Brevibacillus composti TaxID=2796470 RepID=A0A7T5JPX6_9BACL|nr:YheC/YheD family protein [Brevibacillus composti]QQE75526.1 YheC/YheD family protein [Brevibacillus composti]QUO42552.1 YheC/YheD family protein [Brevibacillus composti]
MTGYNESKLKKYAVLRRHARLARALPHTRRFSKEALRQFMKSYRKVIAKPAAGSGGAGVILISNLGGNRYRVHRGYRTRVVHGKAGTYRYIRKRIKSQYLVQRGISLARVSGRPFDIRVMVQRRSGSAWVVTGMLAKVAGPGYIITNIKRSGGRVLPLRTAILRSGIRSASADHLIARLKEIAIASAKQLTTYYANQKVYGLDMALDSSGRVWIIEANLRPDISLFLKLSDKSQYRRIRSYPR